MATREADFCREIETLKLRHKRGAHLVKELETTLPIESEIVVEKVGTPVRFSALYVADKPGPLSMSSGHGLMNHSMQYYCDIENEQDIEIRSGNNKGFRRI